MKRIGVFLLFISISHYAFANVMCEDATDYYAVYEINTYNCESGKYLPANTDGCVACTHGHSCPGGLFTFNENSDQGITLDEYICLSGTFLPAGSDTCSACPAGYTCAGGTFTFNENYYQGAVINSIGTSTMNNVCADNFPADMYAVYEPDTVSLTWDDGNGNTTTSTCTYDGLITLPPEPTRPGYIFNGWKIQTNE
jgi:NAD-dependent dihydropyrimidine dehydrogenase PreA subunit